MTPLDTLHRAYEAWRQTEPQLFWTNERLWPDSGLDEPQAPQRLRFVEPAPAAPISPDGGGLAEGAEPCCDRVQGPDGDRSVAALAAPPAGSAPLSTTIGPGRMSSEDTGDRGQRRSL